MPKIFSVYLLYCTYTFLISSYYYYFNLDILSLTNSVYTACILFNDLFIVLLCTNLLFIYSFIYLFLNALIFKKNIYGVYLVCCIYTFLYYILI